MAEFAAEVRRLMAERGMSLRRLAKAASYNPSYLSKVLSGHKPSSPYLAARLDDALGAGGAIRDATQQPPPRRESKARRSAAEVIGRGRALQDAMGGDPGRPGHRRRRAGRTGAALLACPGRGALGRRLRRLLSARSFAGTLLGRSGPATGRT